VMDDLEDNRFFSMGKRARAQGLPRTIDDGRLAQVSRIAWRAGWDFQDAWETRPAETATARRAEVVADLEALKQSLTA